MIDFKSVKSLVTAREAAEHYGLTVNRIGFIASAAERKPHKTFDLRMEISLGSLSMCIFRWQFGHKATQLSIESMPPLESQSI